jgi:hypothetical protein
MIERGEMILQGTRHRVDLAWIRLCLSKVFKQRVERARMPDLILRHGSSSHSSL